MKNFGILFLLAAPALIPAQTPTFPMTETGLVITRPTQPQQPFTVAGPRGVLVGTQDGQFESWILPVKLLSHLTIEANIEGYSVPIEVNPQSANIEVRPDRTIITYAHIGFTLRQIMFSPDNSGAAPSTGPIVLFQIDCQHPMNLIFRFTPEMRWMWPKRNDGIPGAEWDRTHDGFYSLHMDYPDLAGAVTIPTATPGILAPYQERPQVHPLELHLHYDPTRDGNKFFPLLMAVGTTKETATNESLGRQLQQLNAAIPALYAAHAASYKKLLEETTSIETPDKALNEAFQWGVVSIEQLKAYEFASKQTALVAGYYASADSARPGFGWFFGRDALYTLYAVNSFGDFALTRAELEFLVSRQRADGKIMHEYSQTAADPTVDWKQFPYMYAAADATPLFLMAMRDYYRASGDLAFLQAHKEAIEKAWAFETAPTSDTDHDGIYDNSQGTGWVESWPHDRMPHQEVYLALLDKQASLAYADLAAAVSDTAASSAATARATQIALLIEKEYYDPEKGCYDFSHNTEGDPNGATDKSSTVYPAIAWWDYNASAAEASPEEAGTFRSLNKSEMKKGASASETSGQSREGSRQTGLVKAHDLIRAKNIHPNEGVLTPEGTQPLAHPEACLTQFASPNLATDWGLRDVATTESFYDGMSYHQGSVWPLFTGWGALAEYRANQPLAGEQMLMQNVDLTLAQDPGAVTELLSGDYFVPFGRSTSHQLWSSAMVLTPTLRGLFGISLDAATNTISVNPHLPASWDHAVVRHLHLGHQDLTVSFKREPGLMVVAAVRDSDFIHVTSTDTPFARSDAKPLNIRFQSDIQGAKPIGDAKGNIYGLRIPLPPVEVVIPSHKLPTPGSGPAQIKILSTKYEKDRLTVSVTGPAESTSTLFLVPEQVAAKLRLDQASEKRGSAILSIAGPHHEPMLVEPMQVDLHFPKGQSWQTLEFTLTW